MMFPWIASHCTSNSASLPSKTYRTAHPDSAEHLRVSRIASLRYALIDAGQRDVFIPTRSECSAAAFFLVGSQPGTGHDPLPEASENRWYDSTAACSSGSE